ARSDWGISAWFSHGSGIIISTACGSDRPARCSSSRHSSKLAESLSVGSTIGNNRDKSPGISAEDSIASRARIQLRLPRIVLISPLCARYRYGCANGQDGNVFVENRECTSASAEAYRGSARSGKNGPSCGADSIPL